MKVPIEIDIPDDALLSEWCVAYEYLYDGDLLVGCDYSQGMSGTTQIGLLVGVADAVRADQREKWGPR